MRREIVILGIFVADACFRAERLPRPGETLLGRDFALGPGGKGSNQAVAAARAGGSVRFVTRLGRDPFADIARRVWADAGVRSETAEGETATGAAFVFVDASTGENAIIVAPGAAAEIGPADVEARAAMFAEAAVVMTQLEQPVPAARRALELGRAGGARTILNPAPAAPLDDALLGLCDIVVPNETEAEALTGTAIARIEDADRAACRLIARGAGAALITLGARGAFWRGGDGRAAHLPPFAAGPVTDTTGAGDAFCGAFAAALAEGREPVSAARFGCAAAALSVTRPGTAAAMPDRAEIEALLAG